MSVFMESFYSSVRRFCWSSITCFLLSHKHIILCWPKQVTNIFFSCDQFFYLFILFIYAVSIFMQLLSLINCPFFFHLHVNQKVRLIFTDLYFTPKLRLYLIFIFHLPLLLSLYLLYLLEILVSKDRYKPQFFLFDIGLCQKETCYFLNNRNWMTIPVWLEKEEISYYTL